jgi:hypothetical protein
MSQVGRYIPFHSDRFRAAALAALFAAAAMVLGTRPGHAADTVATAAESTAAPAAHWVERKLSFTYMGFTTKYSCDGLRDQVRDVLLALGARKKDLQIRGTGCVKFNGPEVFPGVIASFWVPVPVTPEDVGKVGATTALPTQWQKIDLLRVNSLTSDQGQCELLEQLRHDALPLFTTRSLHFRSTCVPHQISLGDIEFTVEVLRMAPQPPASSGPAPAV